MGGLFRNLQFRRDFDVERKVMCLFVVIISCELMWSHGRGERRRELVSAPGDY